MHLITESCCTGIRAILEALNCAIYIYNYITLLKYISYKFGIFLYVCQLSSTNRLNSFKPDADDVDNKFLA